MKIRHNARGWAPDRTDPEWAARVEREAEQHTARAEAAWWKAKRRLERAEVKAEDGARQNVGGRRLERLWQAVADRRADLLALERVMRASPAGSKNRGKGSHRGVPDSGSGL